MSSRGELFVTEDVREKFKNKLDKVFGKGRWELAVGDYCNLWDEREFPSVVEIDVMEGDWELDEAKIGEIKVEVKFSIEGDKLYGRAIEVEARKLISITKVGVKNEN